MVNFFGLVGLLKEKSSEKDIAGRGENDGSGKTYQTSPSSVETYYKADDTFLMFFKHSLCE